MQNALELADEHFKRPPCPLRLQNNTWTAKMAKGAGDVYASEYNVDFNQRQQEEHTSKLGVRKSTSHLEDMCEVIARYSNNQYCRVFSAPCKETARFVAGLTAINKLRGGTIPSTGVIVQVADAVLIKLATGPGDVVLILQRTFRLTSGEVTVGHLANYVVLSTGFTLEILGFSVTPHNMLQVLLQCLKITDVKRGLVLIPESLASDFRVNNPVQFALFGNDAVVAAALSKAMRELLEAGRKQLAEDRSGVDEKDDEGPPVVARVCESELTGGVKVPAEKTDEELTPQPGESSGGIDEKSVERPSAVASVGTGVLTGGVKVPSKMTDEELTPAPVVGKGVGKKTRRRRSKLQDDFECRLSLSGDMDGAT